MSKQLPSFQLVGQLGCIRLDYMKMPYHMSTNGQMEFLSCVSRSLPRIRKVREIRYLNESLYYSLAALRRKLKVSSKHIA